MARRYPGGDGTTPPSFDRLFEGFDKSECGLPGILIQIVLDGRIHIPVGRLTRNDRLGLHRRALDFTPDRTRSRSESK